MGFLSNIFGNGNQAEDLKSIISSGAFLVDVRSKAEFESGSANGAVNIPVDQIDLHLDQFKGRDRIVVFCRSGNRSSHAKYTLEKNGIRNVFNGGTWQNVLKNQS